jgi:hypothetical protein
LIRDRQGKVGFRILSRPSPGDRRGLSRREIGIRRSSELGQKHALVAALIRVWNAPITRRSGLAVGNVLGNWGGADIADLYVNFYNINDTLLLGGRKNHRIHCWPRI